MGWKTQTVLIRPGVLDGGPGKLLTDLGYDKHRRISDASFSTAGAGSVWVGSLGDCIILYTYLAGGFFDEAFVEDADLLMAEDRDFFIEFKNALFRHFADAEIAALWLHSVVGAWGFAVFRRGTLVRRQHGYDGMIVCDEGLRLPVEEAFFSRFRRTEAEGEVRYADPAHPEYGPMGVPDLGESLVFEICRSITGVPLNALKADGTNFWLSEEEEAKYTSIRTPLTPVVSVRPWWKFWR